jgi:asparagine synthase (glutamine-hydrolysing)
MRQLRKAFTYAHLPQQERIASYFFWANPEMVSSLLAPELRAATAHEPVEAPLMAALGRLPASTPLLNQMLYLDGKFFVPDHNLNFFDKVSMACGVECRVPLLDIELIKDAASLPTRFKQVGREGKWVFKKAMEAHLPHQVIYRPKTGFGMPLRVWMREELKDLQEDLLSPQALRNRGFFDSNAVQNLRAANERGQIDATYTLLSMMSIEIWSRIFLDRSLTPSLGEARSTSARNHEPTIAMA